MHVRCCVGLSGNFITGKSLMLLISTAVSSRRRDYLTRGAAWLQEQILTPEELSPLHTEQTALLDFLVLTRSRHFVGFGASTFSLYAREYRYLRGIAPRNTTFLMDTSNIGTDQLFQRAGTFA